MSTIAAGTSTTTALVATGDTTGQLVLQTNGTTTAVTIDTSQNTTHVGSSTATAHIPSGASVPTNGLYLPAANTPAISSNTTKVLSVVKGSSLALEGATPQVGTGISFPAAQVASSDVNTLDDYEEGTWTPTMYGSSSAGTTTYGTQAGKYTKVGNVVTVQCYLTWTNATGTGNMYVGGLPFASIAGTGFNQAGQIGYCANLTTPANTFPLFYLGQTNNYLEFVSVPIAGGTCSALAIDTAANVILGITYLAAT